MSIIFKRFRIYYRQLRFKIRSVFKGQTLSAIETAFALPQKSNPRQKISLKYQSYPQLNNYFMQFVNSAESSGRVNGQNLAFLIGPEGAGKTSYIQSNLQRFKHAKQEMANKSKVNTEPQIHKYKSPQFVQNQIKETIFDNEHYLVFNFNFSNNKALNFRSFITQIHQQIIQQILRLNKKFNGQLIDCQTIKQILIAQNSPQYLYVYVKDVIYSIIEDIDPIFISESGKKELDAFNQTINQGKVEALQFFEKDGLYRRLIDILTKQMNVNQTEAALKLFLSVGKRIQYQHRPQTHINTWYQTGIQSTNILFGILNFICGFGKLNKQSFEQYFFQGGYLKTPLKQDKKIKPLPGSIIKRGERIDVVMFFTNLDLLYIYDSPQFWSFFDHVISRTANNSSLRNHFPIMIEFPNYTDFEEVHNMGQFNITSPVVIQLPGYTLHQLRLSNANVAHLFTEQILIQLFYRLGRNPRTWHKAIQQMQKGAKIDDIIKSKAQYILKDNIGLQARINNLFTSPQLLSQISDNSIRYQLIQHLRLIKKANGLISITRPALVIDFFSRPIWRELVKQNIAYTHFYLPYLDISDLPNTVRLNDLKNQLLKGHKWNFLKWQLNNIGKLGIYKRQFNFSKLFQRQAYQLDRFRKQRPQPHLAETYYGAHYNYMFNYKQKGIADGIIL